MLFVSGMRAGALGSLPIEALDLANRTVKQWPSLGVATKNGKSATTYLLDIPELLDVIERWDSFIRVHLPSNAAWYAPVDNHRGDQQFSADLVGFHRNYAPLTSDEVKQRVASLTGQATIHLPTDGDLTEFLRGLSDTQLSQALVVAAERLAR